MGLRKDISNFNSLQICLQDRRIISFSVVNITEKLRCHQFDLGHFFWHEWKELFQKKTKLGKNFIQRERKKNNSLIWQILLIFLYAIQLPCLFDEIRIIFEPLAIKNFQLCLLPKMRLSVDLEGRFTGYKCAWNYR